MCKSILIRGTLVLGLVLQTQSTLAQDEENLREKELEIRALTTLSGSERAANRMHRTIERYRTYKDRVEAKLAKGVDENRAYSGGMRSVLGMSNLSKSLSPTERDILWEITHSTLDLVTFIDSGGVYKKEMSDPYMEEMVVIGSIFDHMPLNPAEFSVADIKIMRKERRHANELYRDGHYDEAYPLLLDLAMRGFKDSQSRLAFILFNGTENVKKSNLRALGWLGSAAFGDTEPQFRVLFNRYMREVPEHVKPTVDSIVDDYQKSFAHDEHQNCSTDHNYTDGSRIKKTFCRFKLEAIAEACEFGAYGGRCWAHAVNSRVD